MRLKQREPLPSEHSALFKADQIPSDLSGGHGSEVRDDAVDTQEVADDRWIYYGGVLLERIHLRPRLQLHDPSSATDLPVPLDSLHYTRMTCTDSPCADEVCI